MARKDDIEEAIIHHQVAEELKKSKQQNSLYRSVCVLAAGAVMSTTYKVGDYVYAKWDAFKAAVTLFIELVKRGGQ